jgi:AraC-like DNA-binding protein
MTAAATTEPAAPRRTGYAASEPAAARALVDHAYGGRLRLTSPGTGRWQVNLAQTDAGVICVSDLELADHLTFRIEGRDQHIIVTVADGAMGFDGGQDSDHYLTADVYLPITPRSDGVCHTREVRVHTVALPAELIAQVARTSPDQPAAEVRFLSCRPAGDGARRWRETTRFTETLFADPAAATEPLIIGSATRLVAATALAIFPNTAVTGPASGDRQDAHPETVRRAASFIEANAHRNIGLADIAGAARVTSRAVQLGFRRHLDTTPTAYLRRIRLDLAHRQLLAADPARETVTTVAYRWGFASPSTFASQYRSAYGILPSSTLRQ